MMKNLFSLIIFTISTACFGQGDQYNSKTFDSVHLFAKRDSISLGSGTGFFYKSPRGKTYLVTNLHCVSNRDFDKPHEWAIKSKPYAPNKLVVVFATETQRIWRTVDLLDTQGKKLYYDFPFEYWGLMADFIALPMEIPEGVATKPVYLDPRISLLELKQTDSLSSAGYPHGEGSGLEQFPSWKSGIFAKDPNLTDDIFPYYYTTLKVSHGMSGSPVYAHPKKVQFITAAQPKDMSIDSVFLGIIFGMENDTNFGILWKASYMWLKFESLEL